GILETKVPEGQEVKIGEVVAVIDDSKQTSEQKTEEQPKKKEPEAKKREQESPKKPEAIAASVDGGKPESKAQATTLSPGVRRIVEEEKLDLQKITGTGHGGRLTKADVLKAVENRGKADPSDVVTAKREKEIEPREVETSGDARFVRKKMSPLRRKIAQQL